MKQFEKLRANYARGTTRSLSWRVSQLDAIEQFLIKEEDKLVNALHRDLGKSKAEAWTTEVGFLLKEAHYIRKNLPRWLKNRRVMTPLAARPGSSYVVTEPLGCVLIIGAWNYPLQLSIGPLIAAVAAGNTVLLKPSELAPHTAETIASALPSYLDSDYVDVVQGDADVAGELIKMPFNHIFYTGGAEVGKVVMREAASNLTPVTLELGGKSPAVVSKDVDIKTAAKRIAWGKWLNAGQTCIAPDYVLVEESQYEPLIKALLANIDSFFGEEPQRSKDYGRIVNERHFNRLIGLLENLETINDADYDRRDLYIKPTLLANPPVDSAIMSEEIFGPLLPVIKVTSIEQAVSFINERPQPLACYLFSNSRQEARLMENTVSAGSLCINDTMMFMLNPELPFGGVGPSGMGRYHGEFGVRTFSHEKAVMKRSFWPDIALRYPPLTSARLKWLKKLL